MLSVERPSSGGIVFKKPQPRDYGFCDESEVQRIIAAEKQRIEKLHKIVLFSFFAVFIVASGLGLIAFRLFSPSFSGPEHGRFLMNSFFVLASALVGLILGMFLSSIAHALGRRIIPPSAEYGKAKQYVDANSMWKARLQREYGYESS